VIGQVAPVGFGQHLPAPAGHVLLAGGELAVQRKEEMKEARGQVSFHVEAGQCGIYAFVYHSSPH
jgi:hypothetical protein